MYLACRCTLIIFYKKLQNAVHPVPLIQSNKFMGATFAKNLNPKIVGLCIIHKYIYYRDPN